MNRLEAKGLIATAASDGLSIIVSSRDLRLLDAAFTAVGDYALDQPVPVSRVCHASGLERIEFATGGSIEFTPDVCLRGRTADLVFVLDKLDVMASLDARIVVASRGGEVVLAAPQPTHDAALARAR